MNKGIVIIILSLLLLGTFLMFCNVIQKYEALEDSKENYKYQILTTCEDKDGDTIIGATCLKEIGNKQYASKEMVLHFKIAGLFLIMVFLILGLILTMMVEEDKK